MFQEIFHAAGQLFMTSPLPTCILDRDLKTLWYNPAVEEKMPFLLAPDGLLSLLPQEVCQKVRQQLEQGRETSVSEEDVPGFLNDVRLLPIFSGGRLEAVTAIFFLSPPQTIYPTDRYGRMLASFDRQLRDPVASIFHSLDVLGRSKEGDGERQKVYLENISRNSYKILRTNLLLGEYMKYTYGSNPLKLQMVMVGEFFDDLSQRMEQLLPEGASIRFSVENERCITAFDTEKLTILLANLWDNSCRFASEEPPCIQVQVSETENQLVISVEDNGRGIPQTVLPEIFSPFYSYTEESLPFGGTGLGLTLCKLIVQQHGGTIVVSSQEGKGTRVTVSLPKRFLEDGYFWVQNELPAAVHDRFSSLTVIMMDTCPRIPQG